MHRKVKELKKELTNLGKIDPQKEIIIDEILKLETSYREIFDKVFYNKFTIEELQKHLNRIKNKKEVENA